MIDNLPNFLLYKKETGIITGDFNSIVDKQDSLLHPDQKLSKCFRKIMKLYNLSDAFRYIHPNKKEFSRYYLWKGVTGATRIDRCYFWGNLEPSQAGYYSLSFSDHLAHVVHYHSSRGSYQKETPRKRSLYRIKHWLVKDAKFQESLRAQFKLWLEIKERFSPIYFWEGIDTGSSRNTEYRF